ncbi:MAG: hypothetical protein ABFQ53_01685 [Patescibacteria group bacterium]
MNKSIKITFWLVVGLFIFMMSEIFMPDLLMQKEVFLSSILLFAIVSTVLAWLTWKSDIKGKLRLFLLLSGTCGTGFMISVVLHNLLYAMSILTEDIFLLKYFFEALHVFFFLVGVFVCPTGLLIGIGGAIWEVFRGSDKK